MTLCEMRHDYAKWDDLFRVLRETSHQSDSSLLDILSIYSYILNYLQFFLQMMYSLHRDKSYENRKLFSVVKMQQHLSWRI